VHVDAAFDQDDAALLGSWKLRSISMIILSANRSEQAKAESF
jgi:hypothetical protein